MKLSDLSEYREFMIKLVDNKYDEAEKALKVCIDVAKKENDQNTLIFLVQNMGNVSFLKGEKDKAFEYYAEAERIDELSPLAKYHTAKFLLEKLKHYDQAIDKCQSVINIVSSENWQFDELGRDYYLAQCYALQGYAYSLIDDLNKAIWCLRRLSMIDLTYTIDYALELCETLMAKGIMDEPKRYLQQELTRLKESKNSDEYKEYMSKIERALKECEV